ncbi:MAG: glycosyltransferase family 39 protein [Thermoguttaceae bacterium]
MDGGRRAAARIFWLVAGLHLLAWTVVPLLVQPVPPLDVIEMRYWGHQWQLGYHKHPPLPAWVAEGSALACGGHFWGVYLASQLGMVACLWAVWRLGRELLSPWLALLGACLLETLFWYTMCSVEYNNNVGMFPFWALAIFFFYRAIKTSCEAAPGVGPIGWWVATGVMLGLGMLSKYTMAVLAATVFLFLVLHPTARRTWRGVGPWLMIFVALAVFSPHLVWAIRHGMPSLGWASSRMPAGPGFLGHLLCPIVFVGSQLLVLGPMLLAIAPLTGLRWRLRRFEGSERFSRDFLLATTLGPFAIQVLMAGIGNVWILSAYGSQLWMFAGLTLLYCLELRPSAGAYRRAAICCGAIGVAFVVGSAIHGVATPYVVHQTLRTHCPSRALATRVHALWDGRFAGPLPVIAGDWWLAGNVAFYGPTIPVIYGGSDLNRVDMSGRITAWTDDEYLRRHGGIIVWNAATCDGDTVIRLRQRFPKAEFPRPISVAWQTGARIPPLRVGVAVVPPAGVPR